tara:strand:- start:14 stop:208 length:195 start_codon:yes stop_codon:yes gene_type:complete
MLKDILEVLDSKAGLNLNLDSEVIRISLAKEIHHQIKTSQIRKNDAEAIHRETARRSPRETAAR